MNFEDVTPVRKLGSSQFTVYLAQSQQNRASYALKLFPYQNNQPDSRYKNEARFQNLNHENVVKIVHSKDLQRSSRQS